MRSDDLSSSGGGGRRVWARPCQSCAVAASAVYCRADAAYLCAGCDARVHAANPVASQHERVWVCQACESAPAALTCRADAAALCGVCDADVHSANSLARRHHRDPILPLPHGSLAAVRQAEEEDAADEEEAASWLLLNPAGSTKADGDVGFSYGAEGEEYLDLVEYNSGTENQSHDHHHHHNHHNQYLKAEEVETEQLVPMEFLVPNGHQNHHQHHHQQQQHQHQHNYGMGRDYEASNAGFSYSSHNVSYSSVEAGEVPETHTMTDISSSHIRASKGTIDLFSAPLVQMPPQFSPVDREARVLRYREKRKMRKFEKTIRYASRKAYAETRPRIKGRFAKRSDVELEVDQMFATSLMSEGGYGIVPSF